MRIWENSVYSREHFGKTGGDGWGLRALGVRSQIRQSRSEALPSRKSPLSIPLSEIAKP